MDIIFMQGQERRAVYIEDKAAEEKLGLAA